jgi:hypothetical protein
MADYTVAKTANTRVFLIDGRARPDHVPSYQSCLRMMGLSQGFGDIERIECPDPHKYGSFIEKAQIRGSSERPTTSLEGRYPQDMLSTLLDLARRGCAFDVQLHTGLCQDPSSFNDYDKVLILEGAYLSNFATEDLGALASGDNAVINETADLSASDAYEIVPLSVSQRAATVVTNEVIDIVICDSVSCGGDCESESTGCEKVYAITKAAGGSAGTSPDIVFSIDGGVTWYAHDIEELTDAQDATAIDCLGDYVVVVSDDAGAMVYALKEDLNATEDPDWTEVTTGFVAGGAPNDIWSTGSYAFIVGDDGYIYGTSDPTSGVDVLDAGAADPDHLLCVHGTGETMAIAGGENGSLVFTTDGEIWTAAPTSPVGVGISVLTVWAKSSTEWWVGTSNGHLYYTLDQAVTWTEKTFSGSGSGVVRDIVFPTDSVGFLSHSTTAPRGRIFRSIDGGYSWKQIPEKTGSMPAQDYFNALAYCTTNANLVYGAGLADDGADGFIVVGQAA